jgi:hypothetical protein
VGVATLEMVETYLERLLEELHEEELVRSGPRFDLPTGVSVWVVDGSERTRRVLVLAQVGEGEVPVTDVLSRVNEANSQLVYGRIYRGTDGVVYFEDTLLAETLERESLSNALAHAAWAMDAYRSVVTGDESDRTGDDEPGDALPAPGRANGTLDLGEATELLVTPVGEEQPDPADGPGGGEQARERAPRWWNAAGYL